MVSKVHKKTTRKKPAKLKKTKKKGKGLTPEQRKKKSASTVLATKVSRHTRVLPPSFRASTSKGTATTSRGTSRGTSKASTSRMSNVSSTDSYRNNCESKRRPKNGKCNASHPYRGKTNKGFACCYVKPQYKSKRVLDHSVGERYDSNIKALFDKGILKRKIPKSKKAFTELIKDGVAKYINKNINKKDVQLIVWDLETTGLPRRRGGVLVQPDIVQIALKNISTGEAADTLIRPLKRIDLGASAITGITQDTVKNVGTFSQFVKSGMLHSYVHRHSNMLKKGMSIKALHSEREKYNLTIDQIQDLLPRGVTMGTPGMFNKRSVLEHMLNELRKQNPHVTGKDTDTQIIFLAHNGNKFDEPVLRAEFERSGLQIPTNWIFADSYYMALSWLSPISTPNYKEGTLYRRYVGQELEGAHNAIADVEGLWSVMKGMFKEVWKRNSNEFIIRKVLEYVFASQLIDLKYLDTLAPSASDGTN